MNRSSELFLNKSSLLIDIHLEKSSTGDVAGFLLIVVDRNLHKANTYIIQILMT